MLVLALLAANCPLVALASDISATAAPASAAVMASTGSGLQYTVLDDTYCEITGYTGTDTELTIPSEIDGYIVKSIAGRAFRNNTTLTTVAFPEGLTSIGQSSFYGCTGLTAVTFNEGLISIGSYSFNGM